jgi:hypothetical protein
MMKPTKSKVFTPLICFYLLITPVWAAENNPFELLKSEQIGTLKLDTEASKLKLPLGCGSVKRGPDTYWGADGAYHQDWVYKNCGLSLGFFRGTMKEPQKLFSVSIKAPSRLRTQRGIGIGSTELAVLKAYAKEYNPTESKKDETLVVGSVYGGLIFTLKQHKVVEIFMGAAAE